MSDNKMQPNIHPKERKSYNNGAGVEKQLRRIVRRDIRKAHGIGLIDVRKAVQS